MFRDNCLKSLLLQKVSKCGEFASKLERHQNDFLRSSSSVLASRSFESARIIKTFKTKSKEFQEDVIQENEVVV